ncbi:MAG: hypothetical protein HY366_02125 [Candidatus Aenigmarchaeota archaeon]|nr:hypothetical protein [Candidatus Aenigmarchaeota archaeon]
MKTAYLAIVLLILLPMEAEAYYFTDYDANVVLDGSAQQTVRATFVPEETLTRIAIGLADSPENVQATLDGQIIETNIQTSGDGYFILAQSPQIIERGVPHELVLTFKSNPPEERTSRGTIYSNAFTPGIRMERYSLTVSLPPGAVIAFENEAPLISPTAALTTDGQRIKLTWERSLNADEPFTAIVIYKEKTLALAPLLLALAAVAYVAYSHGYLKKPLRSILKGRAEPHAKTKSPAVRRKKTEHKPLLNDVRDTLTPDENRIVDVVMRFNGRALQSDVVRDTGWSKSKVSKVLRGLEVKGVLVKQPYGKTNILKISEKYKI